MVFKKGNKFGCKPIKQEVKDRFSKERVVEGNPMWKGGKTKEIICLNCKSVFLIYKNGRESKYCSRVCADTCKIRSLLKSEKLIGLCEENSLHWKGGRTKLSIKLRNSPEGKKWRKIILSTGECLFCGNTTNLEADHIIPFSKIMDEENITIVEQGRNSKRLWDINNGRCLCKKCHDKETYTK